jgi:hypothetical protein
MDIAVPTWAPDQPPIGNFCRTLNNVVSRTKLAYGPLRDLEPITAAISARCQGAFSCRATDGTVRTFAGTAAKLENIDPTDGTAWLDATGASGPYACPEDDFWGFAKYGDLAIAVNVADPPQKFNVATPDTDFSDLGGSPPQAKYVTVWGNYVVLGNLSTANNKIQWSGTDDPESWTVGTDNSDERTFPDSGAIKGLTGGRQKLVFLEGAIWRATEVGGTDIFQLNEISTDRGCAASGSIAQYQDLVFFLARDGFYMLSDGGLAPIGQQVFDQTFWSQVNKNYLSRITAAVDPARTLYIVAWPSSESGSGVCDRLSFYNWSTERWTPSTAYQVEFLCTVNAESGLSLEELDTPYPNLDTMPISLDSPTFQSTDEEALAAFDTAHKLAYFSGATVAATIPSPEAQLFPGYKAKIKNVRPIIESIDDGSGILTSIGVRDNKLNDTQRFTAQVPQRTRGHSPFAAKRTKGRFHMAQTDIAAGTDWTAFQGWDFEAIQAGRR